MGFTFVRKENESYCDHGMERFKYLPKVSKKNANAAKLRVRIRG